MLTRRLGPVVVAIALLAAACGGGGDEQTTANTTPPKKSDSTAPLAYKVVAAGDLSLEVDRTTDIRVLAITADDDNLTGITLLSVGPPVPIEAGGTTKIRAAFDLMRYKGDGSYKIRAGSPRDLLGVKPEAGAAPPDQSNVLFQVWPTGDTMTHPEVFDRALEPCPVTVKDNGRSGRLRCPKLTNDSGKVFSLDMRWGKQ